MMTLEEMQRKKEEMGFSYTDIARRSGVPLATVQKVLSGITKSPRYRTRMDLERVFCGRDELSAAQNPSEEISLSEYPAGGSVSAGIPSAEFNRIISEEATDQFKSRNTAGQSRVVMRAMIKALSIALGSQSEPQKKNKNAPEARDDTATVPVNNSMRTERIAGVDFYEETSDVVHQAYRFAFASAIREIIHNFDPTYAVMIGPVDLALDRNMETVVRPDVFLLHGKEQIKEQRIEGVPEFILEVLSEESRLKDLSLKYLAYLYAGVQEYWCLDPSGKTVTVYDLDAIRDTVLTKKELPDDSEKNGKKVYRFDQQIPLQISSGHCVLDLKEITEELSFTAQESN
ncbi:MAG: Uma2 family endonuclease [Eubacterium sp.]|nr:Uma2 family endonuclease [Eubacterium sp.]